MPPKGKGPKGTLKPSVLDPLCTFCGLPFKSKGITQHQKSCKSCPETVASDARSRAFEEQVQQEGLLDPFIPVIGPSSAYTPLGSIHFLSSTFFLIFQADQFNLGYTHTQLQAGNVENTYDANIAIFNENETINNTDNNNTEPHGEVHTDEGSSSPFEQAPQLNDIKVEYHPRSGHQPQFFSFDEYKSNFQDLDSVDIPVDPEPWKPFRSRLDFELAELILDTHMNKNQTNELISLIHQCILDPKSFTLKNEPDLSKIWENAANRATTTADAWWEIQIKTGYHPLALQWATLPLLFAPIFQHRFEMGKRGGKEFVLDGFQLTMQLQEDSGETGKKKYVNFKRVVWHKAFYEILKSVEQYAETGYHLTTADIERWMFPIVLIASADYEEQCVIALIRGVNSKFPCPVCLIPGDQLANLSSDFPLRFSSDMEKIYKSTIGLNASETEETLKNVGLQDVEVTFKWVDSYISLMTYFQRMLFGNFLALIFTKQFLGIAFMHIMEVYSQIISGKRVDALPTWSGLNHFTSIIKTGEFSDGSKYEDMSKVHTETTIQKGREELLVFEKALHEYMPFNPAKSWSFPKAHTHKHMFDDIQQKGVTRNYNRKPNEKCHVATVIHDDIDYLDLSQAEASAEDSQIQVTRNIIGMAHVSLGSQCAPVAFSDLEDEHRADSAFKDFHKKIGCFFTRYLGRSMTVLDKEYHMALILPMDLPPDLENRGQDNDLRFN
ncbi:uncharacterized protein LACBIDRAFT_329259 [Laccaria bicolor S238N-H82]|uniref:Predicted protein n=1 Tax=Laccaria bicolor (strain S238N-H82 / ATCC MYA-4686) TaxID=486041 RepID=B0DHI9_LACBS|nr:uncharacterized protein LACBIDRAFT_329259 [Laccaria bicolor S238N-H82]EDR06114.1 predicted protein [Laccaria bicolor S238N-H82]|eukprot:XP_001883402.1 predicted protein [Laccaria bicolor S238N-H82]